MKKSPMTKAISLLLCLVLVLGMVPARALAAEETVTGPQLTNGTRTEWLHRLDLYGYWSFEQDLRNERLSELLNPAKDTLLENGDHALVVRQYTGNPTFTYDANAEDPAAAAQEAAAAAVEAAIAGAGNHDLATVTSYATAIYSAFLQDYPEVFWLSGDLLVDEVLTCDVSYDAGEGTASYNQTFYFYLTKADGSFDVRAENYREDSKATDAFAAFLRTARETLHLSSLNNCSRYELLQGVNELLTEINEYNTSPDLSTVSHDCRTALSALKGTTGINGPVSEGYARAFLLLCQEKEIPCTLVTGLVNGKPHTWNYVQMEDGNWYAVDVAMNDLAAGSENAKYFLVGSTTEIDGVAFSDSHIVTNVVTEGGLAFINGPALSENAYVPQSSDFTSTTVYINGKDVTEIDAEDDTISWNPETNTLTLNNASILAENGTYKGSGIYTIGNDTIVLELVGSSKVEGNYDGDNTVFASAAVSVMGDLIIRGNGSLDAWDRDLSEDENNPLPYSSAGIYSGGNLTVEGGIINAFGRSAGGSYGNAAGVISGDFDTPGIFTMTGGTLNATGYEDGIVAFGTMYISGGDIIASQMEGSGGKALRINSTSGSELAISIHISGGTLTLYGGPGVAVGTFLNCSGYENAMYTAAEGGPMTYGLIPSHIGLMTNYLHIEPADLLLVQPNAQNQYTTDVENLTCEEITTDYQWYQEQSKLITDQDHVTLDGYGDVLSTYDEATQRWIFPSSISGNSINYIAFAAEPGNIVTLDFETVEDGFLFIMTAGESTFTPVTDTKFIYTVTEADIDPETGLFVFAMHNENSLEGTVHLAAVSEVQNISGTANRFACDTAGTYFCRATVFQNDAVKGTMESGRFDYLPSNTVTFDPKGGTCETASAETQSGVHTLAALPEASRTGYTFAGWADADGNPVTTDTLITEDITLYAQWTVNKYTLTVEGLDGVIYQEQIPYGTDLDAILSSLNLGDITVDSGVYTFTGVFEPTPEATMPAGAVTLKAVYAYTGWMEEANGITYLIHDEKVYFNEWVEIGSETYYFDANSHVLRDIALLDGEYYAFDHETGKFLADYTGIYEARSGDVYYIKNGVAVERCEIMDHADEDSNGRCDWCDCPVKFAKLRFASVSMNGNLAINYYMLLSDEVLADSTAYMQFTMADGEIVKIPVSEGIKTVYEGETYYVYSCVVKAKEMTDDVICQIFYEGGSTAPFTYSVRTYAMNILEKSKNEDMKALVKAMLHYGAAAQVYFGYNTDRLANAGLEAPDYSGVTINGFDLNLGQGTQNAKFCSVSLLVKSDTTLRFYFDSLIAATYHGRNLNVYQLNGMYYVDVVGIAAKDLDENVTIIINDGTETAEVSFNPMAYCQGVMDDTAGTFSDRLKDLVRAMYLYNQAANAYFEEV